VENANPSIVFDEEEIVRENTDVVEGEAKANESRLSELGEEGVTGISNRSTDVGLVEVEKAIDPVGPPVPLSTRSPSRPFHLQALPWLASQLPVVCKIDAGLASGEEVFHEENERNLPIIFFSSSFLLALLESSFSFFPLLFPLGDHLYALTFGFLPFSGPDKINRVETSSVHIS
jgi:hypothetical protein